METYTAKNYFMHEFGDIACIDSKNYPKVFDITTGVGIEFECNSRNFTTAPAWKNGKRRISLHISTFKTISSVAKHYYGLIRIEGVECRENGKTGGILYWNSNPLADYSYKSEIIRKVTQEDIDDPDTDWASYDVGDYTKRFNSIHDLLKAFEIIIDERFTGDAWIPEVQMYFDSKVRSIEECLNLFNK
jgi:hypothetical protein